jgi:DNA ligase D-like protein (predicted 3'-phosphoesterase)
MKNSKKNFYLIALWALFTALSLYEYYTLSGANMKKKSIISTYEQRRNFTKTSEPQGSLHKETSDNQPIFVIQKHAASHLHYDFRLEIEGVLKSWAIPKGPSTDPAVKHLAVPTEDHPLEYALFEGTIPEDEYGGGTVMIWDIGTFENIKQKNGKLKPLDQCYKDGHLEFFLHGKKLQGGYSLLRIKNTLSKNENWLLIKKHDDFANIPNDPVRTKPNSALTDRSMESIKKESNG